MRLIDLFSRGRRGFVEGKGSLRSFTVIELQVVVAITARKVE